MKIGFIGLGIMGGAMAANLQKGGHPDLVVNDLRRDLAERHLAAGATWGDTPADVARDADVVFTSLPGPPEMQAVALGPNGLLNAMKPGSAYFDLTSNSPTVVRRLHTQFAERGISLLDSPVSGGSEGAKTGKLAFWVSGDEAVYKQYEPVLTKMGDRAMYVGDIGSGSIIKLVHNTAGFILQSAMAEVFALGTKAGMDPVDLWHAIRQGSSGRRRTFDRLTDQFLTNQMDPPSFALKLAHKDVTLATELARELKVPTRFSDLTLADLTEAMNRGWADRDCRIAMNVQLEHAGIEPFEADPAALKELLAQDAAQEASEKR